MASADSSPLDVRLRLDGLDPEGQKAVHSALAPETGLRTTSEEGSAVTVTGPDRDAIGDEAARAPVVAVVDGTGRRHTTDALNAGASGVVMLHESGAMLPAAIRAVHVGLVVVPGATRGAVRRPLFSVREKQILGLLVMGLPNAEIGRRLFVTESTVKYHLLSIYAKLGVKTRKEAVDLILDPSAGLGTGILALREAPQAEDGYSEPTVV